MIHSCLPVVAHLDLHLSSSHEDASSKDHRPHRHSHEFDVNRMGMNESKDSMFRHCILSDPFLHPQYRIDPCRISMDSTRNQEQMKIKRKRTLFQMTYIDSINR